MKLRTLPFVCLLLAAPHLLHAQIPGGNEDESRLYAQTKQVNQFFRRFNGEEDEKGDRYDPSDRLYRSAKLRKNYIQILFDASNAGIGNDLKSQFMHDVLDRQDPALLDFHGSDWFAEVHTGFTMNGQNVPAVLFMVLEKDHLGSKWVIDHAYVSQFDKYFVRDTSSVGRFIHPLSHELDFMNLRKAFEHTDSVSQYSSKTFSPDHLTLLLYELKKGNLRFKTISEVRFHFFQIDGWYFELSEFNRAGYNTGWLISGLVKVNDDSEKTLLKEYLYHGRR